MNPSLKSHIMRRVYYSYLMSLCSPLIFWQGVFLGAATLLLARWLHVASIVDNFLAVPVREVPNFIVGSFFGAISHGEVMTALLTVGSVIIALLAARRLGRALATGSLVAHS